MDDLFHKILIYLYSVNGLNQDVDITDFLKEAFNNNIDSPEILLRVRKTVGHLGVSGYIKRDPIPHWGQETNHTFHTFITDKPVLTLELLGHNYIADKINKANQDLLLTKQTDIAEKSGGATIKTSEFTITNSRHNTYILLGTLVIAAISAIASIRSCQISDSSDKKDHKIERQSQDIELLKQNIEQSRNALSVQQSVVDSLQRILSEKTKFDTPKTPTKPKPVDKP